MNSETYTPVFYLLSFFYFFCKNFYRLYLSFVIDNNTHVFNIKL